MPAWLLILLVVVIALAPLWQFRPSPRQRGVARLREQAALAGLYVEFRDLPLRPAPRARFEAGGRDAIYYGLRLPPSRGEPRMARAWWREDGAWRGPPAAPEPPSPVAELPAWALATGIDEASCGVYWREEGDAEAVAAIAAALHAWRDRES
jgi:hypothetical protein